MGVAVLTLTLARIVIAEEPHAPVRRASDIAQRLQFLTDEIRRAHAEVKQLQSEIADVRHDVDDLIKQLEALSETPDDSRERIRPPGPREVKYRLPLAHISDRTNTEFFVCEDDCVAWIDVRALSEAQNLDQWRHAEVQVMLTGETERGRWQATRGGYDYRFEVTKQDDRLTRHLWIDRKPGFRGETAEEASAATSEFSHKLATLDPEATRVVFAVRSDSFDVYRSIRSGLFAKGFKVNWDPMTRDRRFAIGSGDGIDN